MATYTERGGHCREPQGDVGERGGGIKTQQIHGLFVNENALL